MDINILQCLTPNSPQTSAILSLKVSSSSTPPPLAQIIQLPTLRRLRSLRISATNTDSTRDSNSPPPTPTVRSPVDPSADTPGIRFRRGSRKRSKQLQEQKIGIDGLPKKAAVPAKAWEDMTMREKAVELYVGEKGMLFWLNKLAYASIYIIIGAWILFRFVGPALNLYQLDTPEPMSPSSLFKTS